MSRNESVSSIESVSPKAASPKAASPEVISRPSILPAELHQGLLQLMRHYAGSGIKRFESPPADALEWDMQVESQPSDDVPTAMNHLPSQLDATDDGIETRSHAPLAALSPQTPSPAALVAMPLADDEKQLSLLTVEERQLQLDQLSAVVRGCRKCEELACYRRQTVFGEGSPRPRVCFYGEAPGADEDASGRPFVGAAGKLLTDIIHAMKLTREEVYILNALKCRPPQNRTPLPEEVTNCRAYGYSQLEILQPEFIILLGAVAVRSVLQSNEPVGRLRGRFHQFHQAKVLVTYHPAYLLRTPAAKKMVWEDVQMVMRELCG